MEFDVSFQPLLLVAVSDQLLHQRVSRKLKEARVHFISVSQTFEAVAVQEAIGPQIVGVIVEQQHVFDVEGMNLWSALSAQSRALPALLIGSDQWVLETQLHRMPSGSISLLRPFTDGAFSQQMDLAIRWVEAARFKHGCRTLTTSLSRVTQVAR